MNRNSHNEVSEKVSFLSIVSNIISVITFIFPGVSLAGIIISIKNNFSIWITAVLIILSVAFIIICIIVITNRNTIAVKIFGYIMNLSAPNQSYKLEYKTCTYEYLSRTKMRYEKVFKPKAFRNLDRIYDQFNWTGSTSLKPKVKHNTQHITEEDRKFGMQRYAIKFNNNKSYTKKENIPEMGMEINDIYDPNCESSTHLSSGIYEITDKLILRVEFASDLKPYNFRKLTYLHYTDREHFKCEEDINIQYEAEGKQYVEWIINKPIYGAKYLIDWDFED